MSLLLQVISQVSCLTERRLRTGRCASLNVLESVPCRLGLHCSKRERTSSTLGARGLPGTLWPNPAARAAPGLQTDFWRTSQGRHTRNSASSVASPGAADRIQKETSRTSPLAIAASTRAAICTFAGRPEGSWRLRYAARSRTLARYCRCGHLRELAGSGAQSERGGIPGRRAPASAPYAAQVNAANPALT